METKTPKKTKPAKVLPRMPTAYEITRSAKEAEMDGKLVGELVRQKLMEATYGREPDGKRVVFKHRRETRGRKKGAPNSENSLAALEMHRAANGWIKGQPRNVGKLCAKFIKSRNRGCLRGAVRNCDYCPVHGGRRQRELNLLAKYHDYRPDRAVLGSATLKSMVFEGMFPVELLRDVPQFAEAFKRARRGVTADNPLFEHMTYGERRLHHERCVVLCLGFIAAWDHVRVRGDYAPWTSCVRDASALGIS